MNNTHTQSRRRRRSAHGSVVPTAAFLLMGCALVSPTWAQAGAGGAAGGTGASSTGTAAGAAGTAGTGAAGTGTAAGTGQAGATSTGQAGTGAGVGTGVGTSTGQTGMGAGTSTGQTNGSAGQTNGSGTASSTNGTTNGVSGTANGGFGSSASGTTAGQSGAGIGSGSQSPGASASGSLLPSKGPAVRLYDLPRTIADALKSSSDIQVAQRNVQIDKKRADEALAAGRPSVSGQASATRFDQATKVSIGMGPPVQVLGSHQEQLSILLGERFDITGQIRASSNQFFLQSTADQYTLGAISNARILRAKTLYFSLLRAQHQVQVAQAALVTAQRQLLDAQNLNAGQVGQKIDVYRAATQVAQDQQQVTSAINNEQIAQQNFNDLVGRPLSSDTQVQDVPGVSVGNVVVDTKAVGADTQATFAPFTVPPEALADINLDQALNTAFAERPELLVDQVNVRVAQVGITLARAGLLPTLAINASANYFPTTSFQEPRRRTAAITATLTVPLYDGGATRDRVDEAHLRTDNARTSLDSDKSAVALDVRQSYLNLLTNARQIDAANTALQQAVAARQLAQIRYEGQVGLYLEVTDAQAALVQAETNQVDSVYNYLISRAQYENAIGRPQLR